MNRLAAAEPVLPLPSQERQTLAVANLLQDLESLCGFLERQLAQSVWLDSFLLAAGMHQITEDWLHRELPVLGSLSLKLSYVPGRGGAWAQASARLARERAAGLRARAPREQRIWTWQARFEVLVQSLADVVAKECAGDPGESDIPSWQALLRQVPTFPEDLRRSLPRLPTAFRSLDQHPLDCQALVQQLTLREPDPERPLLVVGVRTSGSYLAPLHAAFLRRAGYGRVKTLTLRPRQALLHHEHARLRSAIQSHALLLLADDPPSSGFALASIAAFLERYGAARPQIVPLVALLGPEESLPDVLAAYRPEVLSGDRWSIQKRLEPEHVRHDLQALLRGKTICVSSRNVTVADVRCVQRLPLVPIRDLEAGSPVRRHVRARFRATILDGEGRGHEHDVYVKGVGLGYFGAHAMAVGEPLADFLPAQYGIRHGLLFREWLSDERRLDMLSSGAPLEREPERVADYVATRRTVLAVPEDHSLRLAGEAPAWERVAGLFRAAFRNVKPTLVDGTIADAAKALLAVDSPSVIDGSMGAGAWFTASHDHARQFLKVDYDERAFSNQDTVTDQLYCYDAAFDVAAAAASRDLHAPAIASAFRERLRSAYAARTGSSVDAERMFLYQWLHVESYLRFVQEELFPGVFSRRRSQRVTACPDDVQTLAQQLERGRRAQARFSQTYFAERVFHDVQPVQTGPLCGIDLDGVLETLWLGFLSITPRGALALRALSRHGYRPVLVTGRSLGDVQERCAAYHLTGGVAEYGAAVYNHVTRRTRHLLSDQQTADLKALRECLASLPGIHIDPAYALAVRAYRFLESGKRRALSREMVDGAIARTGLAGRVYPIVGVRQTDFMVTGVDKSAGLRALAADMDGTPAARKLLTMAIGDTASDLPMLAHAELPFAPANAERTLADAGVAVMRHPHQRGLEAAVGRVLGHRPGTCPTCTVPALPTRAKLLLNILDAQDSGGVLSLRRALRVRQLVVNGQPRVFNP